MAQLYFSLVIHNHQPVGNFDFVFQNAFEQAYQPLANSLDEHRAIKVAMHFTGPLIDWLKLNQPAYLDQVAKQVERGQIEVLSGAYYEPILAMLSDADKIGQIEKLNQTVQSLFGTTPTGMWLAERIWEPHLPMSIHQANIRYTLIDDTHFITAGFNPGELFGYFVTEEQGYHVNVVPTQTELRPLIPWQPVNVLFDWLWNQKERGIVAGKPPQWVVLGEDGEKFGMWPNMKEFMWDGGWLKEFFERIENSSDWLTMIHPSDYIENFRAAGIAYLPTASYREMGEWALPSPDSYLLRDLREGYEIQLEQIPDWDGNRRDEIERVLRFLRGSFWRNFLVKYPEINQMQKRVLALSKRAYERPPSEERTKILNHIWAAQCNAAYWHGVFGGVYMFHIRSANYTNLIQAETLMDAHDGVWADVKDFNADTYEEVFAGNGTLMLIVDPRDGGKITELDYRPIFYNLLNIMSRHPEGYHIQIQEAAETHMLMTPGDDPSQFEGEPILAKEHGLEKVIYVDWHRRGMFNDHFLGPETTLQLFESVQYPQQGDFVDQPYHYSCQQSDAQVEVQLARDGMVWLGETKLPVRVEKTFSLVPNTATLQAHYRVTNVGDRHLNTRFGVELAFGYDGGDNIDYCYLEVDDQPYGMGHAHEFNRVNSYRAVTKIRQFATRFTISQAATLWTFPLAPITLSEAGFERVHQGVVTMPFWTLDLAPQQQWEATITLDIAPIK